MKASMAWLVGLTGVFISVVQAAGDPPPSDALLPPGLVMEQAYRPGPGDPVGKVAEVFGEAVIVHADAPRGYHVEAALDLYTNDLVVTRESARVAIALNDGSRVALAAVTRLVIDKSVYESDAKRRESIFGLSLGKARFLVKKIMGAKRTDFIVKTATAIAGVRGSDFVIAAAAGTTEVTALKNTRLEVAGLTEPGQVVLLTDYQRSLVPAGQLPSSPEEVPPAEIERLLKDLPMDFDAGRSVGAKSVGTLPGGTTGGLPGPITAAPEKAATPSKGAALSATVVNQVAGEGVGNVAAGKGASANLGALKVESSTVSGSLVNVTEVKNVDNVATGGDSQANVGAIVVE